MDRKDYYEHYQSNLQLQDCEMEQVKIAAQQAIGEKAWLLYGRKWRDHRFGIENLNISHKN